jgi:signal transduction histidine kinase/DNA-binding LacI/PurR family transcriptional regulator
MRRIAFLLDYLYVGTFQQEAVAGLVAVLAGSDTELHIFLGGPVKRDLYDAFVASRNSIYDLVSRDMFDGIIVCNSLGNNISVDEMSVFLERFAGLPIVFFGNGPDRYHRVMADNRSGVEQLIGHFAVDHGYRRIAFVTGPRGNFEAEERLAAYRQGLERAGLPFDPDLVCEGDFNLEKGQEAVRTLLDVRRLRFDALIAANDFMALGAKLEMEKRGMSIPTDAALAGFDDTLDAMCVIPSLTTVRQPYELIARKALSVLAGLARGEDIPRSLTVPAQAIIRQSCGCYIKHEAAAVGDRPLTAAPAATFAERRAELVDRVGALLAARGLALPAAETGGFLDAIFRFLAGEEGPPALMLLQRLMLFGLLNHVMVEHWHDVLSLVRRLLFPVLAGREMLVRAEDFFHEARILVSDLQSVEKNQNLLLSLKQSDQVSEVSQSLFATVESKELAGSIYRTFPLFNIKDFLFAEYVSPDLIDGARVVACIRGGIPFREVESAVFPARRLLPSGEGFGSRVWFVLPIAYQEKKLGYVMYGKIEGRMPLYSTMGGELAGSFYFEKVKGWQPPYTSLAREIGKSWYIGRLIALEKEVESELRGLTQDLELRNRELEEFTHIVSHDLKEPLRKISFFGERLEESAMVKLSGEELDSLKRMRHAAARMRDLIDGLLAYSRVAMKERQRLPTDLNVVVAEVLQDLDVRLGETGGTVRTGPLPTVPADPLQMRELFQNLIGNALKYHRDGIPPLVVIEAVAAGDGYDISVSDNGIGFDPKYNALVFNVFQRLTEGERYEGSGIGLAICKKIVERHGGAIHADGGPEQGATFTFSLPAR